MRGGECGGLVVVGITLACCTAPTTYHQHEHHMYGTNHHSSTYYEHHMRPQWGITHSMSTLAGNNGGIPFNVTVGLMMPLRSHSHPKLDRPMASTNTCRGTCEHWTGRREWGSGEWGSGEWGSGEWGSGEYQHVYCSIICNTICSIICNTIG